MPMSFPDMDSLVQAAEVHKFRGPNPGETEAVYREALANHVVKIDRIESMEIRSSRGWDQWSQPEAENLMFGGPVWGKGLLETWLNKTYHVRPPEMEDRVLAEPLPDNIIWDEAPDLHQQVTERVFSRPNPSPGMLHDPSPTEADYEQLLSRAVHRQQVHDEIDYVIKYEALPDEVRNTAKVTYNPEGGYVSLDPATKDKD